MSAPSKIICACGRQIEGREVLQHGYFMSHWKPVWVFLKYRCSRCRMLGEKLVDYNQWDERILDGDSIDETDSDTARPIRKGPIDAKEVQQFAERLRTLRPSDLDHLAESLP
ncbi:MAG: hypothetical protein ACUVX8_11905 [Candidatus Zipacnadales bacterium]